MLAGPAAAFAQAPAPAGTPPAAAPTPIPFPEALQRAAADLFSKADLAGDGIALVIDPLIDGISGAQST